MMKSAVDGGESTRLGRYSSFVDNFSFSFLMLDTLRMGCEGRFCAGNLGIKAILDLFISAKEGRKDESSPAFQGNEVCSQKM